MEIEIECIVLCEQLRNWYMTNRPRTSNHAVGEGQELGYDMFGWKCFEQG